MKGTIGDVSVADILLKVEELGLTEKETIDLIKCLREGKPLHPHKTHQSNGSKVTKIVDIVRTYTCAFCGSRYTKTIQLSERETLCTTNKEGKTITISTSGPYTTDSWVHTCSCCADFVKKLSREELENKVLEMAKSVPLPKGL